MGDPANMKRTAKNKLVPRGQQNRLHLNKVTQKGEQKSCLEVNEIDFTKKHTARNKLIPRSQQNRLHQRRLPKRSKKRVSRSSKSTSPKEEHCKKKTNLP